MTALPPTRLARTGLYLTVFVTGAAVMVIELLGTRVIAPFYGTSLHVWSSLISVTMIALAGGYFLGGQWADRERTAGLSLIVSLAGLAVLCIPWATRPVLLATDPLGLRAGAFVSALVLFAPSLTLLGMVGPFAVKLATARLDGVGTSAGSIYAVSTLGSVLGTLLLGFFLFPVIGSRTILIGLSAVLMLLGMAARRFERSPRRALWLLPPLLGLAALPLILDAGRDDKVAGQSVIRSEVESLYGWVRVIDQPEHRLRLLTSDASMIGAASLTTGANQLTYQKIVQLIPAMAPPVRRALLIGQGAGHMAMTLKQHYGIDTDTVEIDPAVAAAAIHYFGFVPTGEVRVGDGRYELRRLHGPYDLIIHDCFTGGSEPAHLLTVEALSQLRGLLSERGMLALNFVAFAHNGRNPALASVFRTVGAVFPHVSALVSEPGEDFNDFIFLASSQSIDLAAPSLAPERRLWLKERLMRIDPAQGVLLTDDLNPLEHLQTAKAEEYRRFVVEWLGAELLVP